MPSLPAAYATLFRQWELAFRTGAANRALGARPTPVFQLLGRLFRNPSEFAVFLRESRDDPENETSVELHAYMFGFGPIPRLTLRKRIATLRGYVEHVATQPLPDGAAEEEE